MSTCGGERERASCAGSAERAAAAASPVQQGTRDLERRRLQSFAARLLCLTTPRSLCWRGSPRAVSAARALLCGGAGRARGKESAAQHSASDSCCCVNTHAPRSILLPRCCPFWTGAPRARPRAAAEACRARRARLADRPVPGRERVAAPLHAGTRKTGQTRGALIRPFLELCPTRVKQGIIVLAQLTAAALAGSSRRSAVPRKGAGERDPYLRSLGVAPEFSLLPWWKSEARRSSRPQRIGRRRTARTPEATGRSARSRRRRRCPSHLRWCRGPKTIATEPLEQRHRPCRACRRSTGPATHQAARRALGESEGGSRRRTTRRAIRARKRRTGKHKPGFGNASGHAPYPAHPPASRCSRPPIARVAYIRGGAGQQQADQCLAPSRPLSRLPFV